MNPIRRREFLEWGALATLSAGGCAGTKELLPPSEPISTAHMDDYLLRLDRSMGAILEADTTLNGLLPPRSQRVAQGGAAVEQADAQFRRAMRSLLISGSFRDLPERAQLHPGMQQRLWAALPEMNQVVTSNNAYLAGLLPAQKAELDLLLRDQPDLTRRLAEGLDLDAMNLGVPLERRRQLRRLLGQVDFRLRSQSVAAVCDEYVEKMGKMQARAPSLEAMQQQWVARMGEKAFWEYRRRIEDQYRSWSGGILLGGAAGNASSSSGTGLLTGGAVALGIGGLLTALGAVLVAENLGWSLAITFGVIGLLVGLVLLIVGGVVASRD